MNEVSTYTKVIDILTRDDVDFRAIAVRLAKEYPAIFVEMVAPEAKVNTWHREVVSLMVRDQKINAIRVIREKTGLSLKEAKDIADYLQNLLYATGKVDRAYDYAFDHNVPQHVVSATTEIYDSVY